jgi:hypothetical protein
MSLHLGWLDLDAAGLSAARAFMAGPKDTGTIDELGFGPIRQIYADLFFPATNTQMTRARYFLLIPGICRALERMGAPPEDTDRNRKDLENALTNPVPG